MSTTTKDTFVSYIDRLVCDAKVKYALKVWAALGNGKPAPRLAKPWAAKVVAKVTALHNAELGTITPTAKSERAAKASTISDETRAKANAAWKTAFDAAPDGQRKIAAKAAYAEVCNAAS